MDNSLNSKHIIYAGLAVTGLIWLAVNLVMQSDVPTVCITRQLAGVPCPTCGVTDSVVALLNGKPGESMSTNAFGPLVLILMIAAGIFVVRNVVVKQLTFSDAISEMEVLLVRRKKLVYILLISLFINWMVLLYRYFT